jgi:RNA polymerase sigma factor (sigma-70 family)
MLPTEDLDDAALLALVDAGDNAAYAAFYRRHHGAVLTFLLRRTRDRELSHDLTAETFFAAARSAGTFQDTEGSGAGPWLMGIARNRWREHSRRGQAEQRALTRVAGRELDETGEEYDRVDERVSAAADEITVQAAIADLPDDQRHALLARVVDERDYSEIAQELGTSEAVVRQRVHRGLRRLRVALLIILALTAVAAAAYAASHWLFGRPATKTNGFPGARVGIGVPTRAGSRLVLQAPDPDGGPPWGLRVLKTTRGAACLQIGRVVDGQLGVLGIDGAFANDHRFHPLAVDRDQCTNLRSGRVAVTRREADRRANGALRPTCHPAQWMGQGPLCPRGALRHVLYGLLGPNATAAELRAGSRVVTTPVTASTGGAYLFIDRITPAHTTRGIVGPWASVTGVYPPGARVHTPPSAAPPALSSVRARVRVQRLGRGRHAFYRIAFHAPLPTRTTRESYFIAFSPLPNGAGKHCTQTFRFGKGFSTDYDMSRGRPVRFGVSPAIALRWHAGWCPGHYRGGVYFINKHLLVGAFGFTVR